MTAPLEPARTRDGAGGADEGVGAGVAEGVGQDLDVLVGEWLTLPDLAERLGTSVGGVRRLLEDGELLAVRRGERSVLAVPARFLTTEGPLPHLRGTLTVLRDGRVEDHEALRWLFTPDPTLPGGGSPLDSLVAGQKTEIRRRAAELAL